MLCKSCTCCVLETCRNRSVSFARSFSHDKPADFELADMWPASKLGCSETYSSFLILTRDSPVQANRCMSQMTLSSTCSATMGMGRCRGDSRLGFSLHYHVALRFFLGMICFTCTRQTSGLLNYKVMFKSTIRACTLTGMTGCIHAFGTWSLPPLHLLHARCVGSKVDFGLKHISAVAIPQH